MELLRVGPEAHCRATGAHLSDIDLHAARRRRMDRLVTAGLAARPRNAEEMLRAAAELPRLAALDLSLGRAGPPAAEVGDEGLRRLAEAGGAPGVRELVAQWNFVRDDGATALAEALPALERLDLSWNGLGPQGATALATGLPRLTELSLRGQHDERNGVAREGLAALATHATRLEHLDVSNNPTGAQPILETLELPGALPALRSLAMDNCFGVRGEPLAAFGDRLERLSCSGARLGDAGATALAAALPRLCSLSVAGNQLTDAGAAALASLSQLRLVDVKFNKIGNAGVLQLLGELGCLRHMAFYPVDADSELDAPLCALLRRKPWVHMGPSPVLGSHQRAAAAGAAAQAQCVAIAGGRRFGAGGGAPMGVFLHGAPALVVAEVMSYL